jgi:hypothetical protein
MATFEVNGEVEIDLADLASEIDLSDLAGSFDYGELAGEINASDVAEGIDLDNLAREISTYDLARELDYSDIASEIDMTELAEAVADRTGDEGSLSASADFENLAERVRKLELTVEKLLNHLVSQGVSVTLIRGDYTAEGKR